MDRVRPGQLTGVVVRQIARIAAVAVALGGALSGARLSAAGATQHFQVRAPVLIYHHVKWNKPSDDAIERGLTVHPPVFEAQIKYLLARHYHPTTALRLVEFLRTGTRLPSRPAVITFDDGYSDVYTVAYPILRKLHVPATLFVVPGLLGQPRYMTWKQVLYLGRHGMDVESHTMTHPDLTVVPALQMRGEIDQSRATLQGKLHHAVHLFCYPYGAYNGAVLREVVRAGYWAAFTTHQGDELRASDLLTLPRVYPGPDPVPTLAVSGAAGSPPR